MQQKKSLVYFGSPDFSAKVLLSIFGLSEECGISIDLVVTQPDKPAGRGLMPQMTPVKKTANDLGIRVFEYKKERRSELIELIKQLNPTFGILYAFNEIIPETILDLFPNGLWNIHPSLLPLFRGPTPVAYPIMLGHKKTGVTIICMDKTMDTGGILAQKEIPISESDSSDSLLGKLSVEGFLLCKKLFKMDSFSKSEQDGNMATYTKKIKREDGYISKENIENWINGKDIGLSSVPLLFEYLNKTQSHTPREYIGCEYFSQMHRALTPWPGIWTSISIDEKVVRLKILELDYLPKDNFVTIKTVQMEGKKPVAFKQWNDHYKVFSISEK